MSQPRVTERPADRYGRRTIPSRRNMTIFGGVFVTLITVWVAWASLGQSTPEVTFSTLSNRVVGPTGIEVTFQISMEPGERAVCTVQAQNPGLTVVGWVDTTIEPSKDRILTRTVLVPTMEEPASGDVKACVLG